MVLGWIAAVYGNCVYRKVNEGMDLTDAIAACADPRTSASEAKETLQDPLGTTRDVMVDVADLAQPVLDPVRDYIGWAQDKYNRPTRVMSRTERMVGASQDALGAMFLGLLAVKGIEAFPAILRTTTGAIESVTPFT